MKNLKNSTDAWSRRLIVSLYLVLILGLGFLLWKNFYVKKVEFFLGYGEESSGFLKYVEDTFGIKQDRKLAVIFIFNKLPDLSQIENIGKLFHKHKNECQFFAIFHKRFRTPLKIDSPFEFFPNYGIVCHYLDNTYNSNYFVLVNEKKVVHVDTSMDSTALHFLLDKNLHPERDYSSYSISNTHPKEKVVGILKKGPVTLLDLKENAFKKFDRFKDFHQIFLIIAKCTSCEFKSLVYDLKLRQVLNTGKTLVIFPVFANESQLIELMEKEKVDFPIYLDYNDEFDLFSMITNPRDKFIVIESEDIKVKELIQ